MPDYRAEFVRLVSNSPVVCNGNPALTTDLGEPFFVGGVMRKVVDVTLDREPGSPQDLGELLSEVSIREEDMLQAARS